MTVAARSASARTDGGHRGTHDRSEAADVPVWAWHCHDPKSLRIGRGRRFDLGEQLISTPPPARVRAITDEAERSTRVSQTVTRTALGTGAHEERSTTRLSSATPSRSPLVVDHDIAIVSASQGNPPPVGDRRSRTRDSGHTVTAAESDRPALLGQRRVPCVRISATGDQSFVAPDHHAG